MSYPPLPLQKGRFYSANLILPESCTLDVYERKFCDEYKLFIRWNVRNPEV